MVPQRPLLQVSKIHLVDLAGSERTKRTNPTGQSLKEANCINKSLMFLEQASWFGLLSAMPIHCICFEARMFLEQASLLAITFPGVMVLR